MKTIRLFTLLLLLCGTLTAGAQPYCTVRTFNIRDGLAANFISGLGQTDDGLMWASTWNGLCCYDGYQFTTFRGKQGAEEVLTTNRLIRMIPNKRNNLWCVTYDRNIYLFDTHECRFISVSDVVRQKYNMRLLPRNIYSLKNGHTWITCEQGLKAALRIDDQQATSAEGIDLFWFDRQGLEANYINKVLEDADGREWVLTDAGVIQAGQGGCVLPCRYEYMVQVGSRVFFAATNGQLAWWKEGQQGTTAVTLPQGVGAISCMEAFADRWIALGTDCGVVLFDTQKDTARLLSVQLPTQPSPQVTKLFIDSRQRIWAFTQADGLVLIDEQRQAHWMQTPPVQGFVGTTGGIPVWVEDSYGTIWTVPRGGNFGYYDEARQQLVPHVLQSVGYEYANIPDIRHYMVDSQNNLWFNSSHDLSIVNFKYHTLKYVATHANEETRAMLVDRSGRLWVGGANGYLSAYDAEGRLEGYLSPEGTLQTAPVKFSYRIYSLYEDRDGRLWVGTKGSGLYMLNDSRVRHFMPDTTNSYSLSHTDVYDIDQDERGHIWVGTYENGLNLIDEQPDGQVRFLHADNSFTAYPSQDFSKIRRITHDGRGTVLLSTSGGLVTFSSDFKDPADIQFYGSIHIKGDTTSLLTGDVLQTQVMRSGRIFVATMGGGMQELVSDNLQKDRLSLRTLRQFSQEEGNVLAMTEDADGKLWVARETTIDRFDPETGELSQFGPNALGDRVEFSEAHPAFDPHTGRVTIGAMGGIVTFMPQQLHTSDYSPHIAFTSVKFQGEDVAQPILNSEVLYVPSDKRNLTISFAALDYSNNYLVRYAYMLEGVDHDWTYVSTSHQASFNHITAGRHRLLVKSTNSDGVWADNLAVLVIDAQPTFWESIWGKLLIVAILAGIIALLIHIYLLRHRARMERELSQVKSQFYSDVSHKLRTPLTLISGPVSEVLQTGGLSDVAREHLEMVSRNARHMLDLVNKMLKYSIDHGVYISDESFPAAEAGQDAPELDELSDAIELSDDFEPTTRLLIVEDNDDLRAFLRSILQSQYQVLLAENGKRGLEMAEHELPDFIITDVMMPEMDGLTMVHHIKQNKDICHIPIIVLSAKASLDDRLQGLREGIDDYITKPFSATYLKQRVENIIAQRRMLQQTYLSQLRTAPLQVPEETPAPEQAEAPAAAAAQPEAAPAADYRLEAPQIIDADQEMMKRLLAYLEQHIGDANLKIDDLADAVNLGRSVFYGKIKSITGMTPVDFLRHIRIQRAEDLIARSSYSFSQIAYMVGFSDPKYFSKCFKKGTGMTPSEYREKAGD